MEKGFYHLSPQNFTEHFEFWVLKMPFSKKN